MNMSENAQPVRSGSACMRTRNRPYESGKGQFHGNVKLYSSWFLWWWWW